MKTAFEVMCQEFKVQDETKPHTHTLMSGGRYYFSDDEELAPQPAKPPTWVRKGENYIDRVDFISTFLAAKQRRPTVAEFAYAALSWWWANKSNPWEGISLVSSRPRDQNRPNETRFLLYFDLDMRYAVWDDSLWVEQQKRIATSVRTVVLAFFERRDLEMSVAVTDQPRWIAKKYLPTHATSEGTYKVGMHFYFPELPVNLHEASVIVQVVRGKIREEFGERDLLSGENSWSDVFDSSVYRSGLRDCFTFKTNNCKTCKSAENKFLDTNSLYMPKWLITPTGVLPVDRQLAADRGYLLGKYDMTIHELFRIRSSKDREKAYASARGAFTVSYPQWIERLPGEDQLPQPAAKRSREVAEFDPFQYEIDAAALKKANRSCEVIFFAPDDLRRIEMCIRSNFDEARYRSVQVRSVYAVFYRDKDKTVNVLGQPSRFSKVKITLKGDGSRYCFNKGDHHNSNTVYFEAVVKNPLTLPVLEQRCWSPHPYKSNGVVRTCDRFHSSQLKPPKVGRIPDSVVRLLFHHSTAQPKVQSSP